MRARRPWHCVKRSSVRFRCFSSDAPNSGAQTKEETVPAKKQKPRKGRALVLLIYMSCAHRRVQLHLWRFGQPIGHALLRHLLPHLLRKPVCRGREDFGAATTQASVSAQRLFGRWGTNVKLGDRSPLMSEAMTPRATCAFGSPSTLSIRLYANW